jgi:prepilin-type N-terminal cleavage/methylation domain-containing protein
LIRRGFTLIEMLVVISVIALLVVMLMPSLSRARELARQASCASNVRNLGWALQAYVNTYNCWPTNDASDVPFKITWQLAEFIPPSGGVLADQNVNSLYFCPSAKNHGPNGDYAFVAHRSSDLPAWPNSSKYNARPVMGYKFHRKSNAPMLQRQPGEVALAGDGAQPPKDQGYHFAEIHYAETYAANGNYSASIVPRHITNTLLLFMDSHAEIMPWGRFTEKIVTGSATIYRCTALFDPRYY